MPKQLIDRHMKFISVLMFTVVFLCSFFGFGIDNNSYGNIDHPFRNNSYISLATNLDEIISSEEITAGVSQVTLFRQLSTRKNSVDSIVIYFINSCLTPTLFLAFLAFMNLYETVSNSSNRFIISFIHNKDGQKA